MSISRLSLLILLAIFATSIQAETINCTPITTLPATITAQGIYCLTGNLATSQISGNAITINANNVTLDLNGWKVGGQAAGTSTQANGIFSSANNVTIKNGIVRGFLYGIYLGGSGVVVRDMLADSNTYAGIYITGLGALVEHNQVVNTGGSTINNGVSAVGIEANGNSSIVSDNMVAGITVAGNGNETGIGVAGSYSAVRNNVVSNTAQPSIGTSDGISMSEGIALNNTVSNFVVGISSDGIYAYNTVYGCDNDFLGGTAGAGNSGT